MPDFDDEFSPELSPDNSGGGGGDRPPRTVPQLINRAGAYLAQMQREMSPHEIRIVVDVLQVSVADRR